VLRYVRAFNRQRMRWITHRPKRGPSSRMPKRVEYQIVMIAQHEPAQYGLHYGTCRSHACNGSSPRSANYCGGLVANIYDAF
jgi:hypothetical protein